jgi:hypothetical protein
LKLRFLAVAAVALAAVAGCGDDDDDSDQPSQPSLAEHVATWRGAANSYNSFLQTCQVRTGVQQEEGAAVIPSCTRQGREAHARASQRLQQALAAGAGSSPECQQAVAQMKTLSTEVGDQLTRSYRAYVAAERATLQGRAEEYEGPALIPLLNRTDKLVERAVKRTDALRRTIEENCEA